jgi:hypothetical protein
MRPRILVVSYHAANPLTPRGARTQAIAEALSAHAHVHVIGGPRGSPRRPWWQKARDRALSEFGSRWLIDPLEPWSWKALGLGLPDADLALLIGYPFSPLVVAGRALRRHAVPYVLDMSDPWVRVRGDRPTPTLRDRRNAAHERRLWAGATAGIVTTAGQARDVVELAPALEILVRPNGYADVRDVPVAHRREARDELRVGHFGDLYSPRVDMTPFLRRLAESDRWRRVVLHQYGRDERRELRKVSELVRVQRRDPIPWAQVVGVAAAELDLVLVVGNKDPRQLPSKAIEYLTLPVARLALTSGLAGDALAEYADGKPGWVTLSVEDPDPAARIQEHVERNWTPQELAPPPDESWSHVAEQLATFVLRRIASV